MFKNGFKLSTYTGHDYWGHNKVSHLWVVASSFLWGSTDSALCPQLLGAGGTPGEGGEEGRKKAMPRGLGSTVSVLNTVPATWHTAHEEALWVLLN